MKKLLIVLLVVCLTLLVTGTAFAVSSAFENTFKETNRIEGFAYVDDLPSFGGWYYIEKENPSTNLQQAAYETGKVYNLDYHRNDQAFMNLIYIDRETGDPEAYLKGSFFLIPDFLYLGFDYYKYGDTNYNAASGGVRFNLGKAGYIAAGADYALNDDYFAMKGIIDYKVSARFYTKKSRFYGQMIQPNKEVYGEHEEDVILGGFAYQVIPNLVLGTNYFQNGDYTYYDYGATGSFWKMTAEVSSAKYDYGFGSTNKTLDLNLLLAVNKSFQIGVESFKNDFCGDPFQILKAKWDIAKQSSIIFMRQLENESAGEKPITYLRWRTGLRNGGKVNDGVRAQTQMAF